MFRLLVCSFFGSLLGLASAAAASPLPLGRPAAHPDDTIVVRLPNQAVLTLQVRDAAQLRELRRYHLDSLTTQLAGYIAQAEAAAQASPNERVTMNFYPAKDRPGQNLPEEVRITARKPQAGGQAASNRVEVFLEKKMGITINVDGKEGNAAGGDANRAERQAQRDSTRLKNLEKSNGLVSLVFDLGLNALVNQKPYLTSAGPAETVRLRPEGSRYVNIGFDARIRLGGKRSPLLLVAGPEFAFNNYMLNGNDKWVRTSERTEVVRETGGRQFDKTKLATAAVNLPLMLQLGLRDQRGKPTLSLGAGGFVGYRLKSWTKLKYTEDGETRKDKEYDDFNLTDFQYGLQGLVGYRSLQLFAKYNMNQLFRAGQGPDTQVLSFGLRIFGN